MIRNTCVIAWKELQVLFRDRGQLVVLFLMPIMFASIIGSVFGGGSSGIEIYLVNHDSGSYSAHMVDVLHNIEALSITELETVERADEQVADGEALAAIVIPADFSSKIDAFEPTQVQVIVDPTQQQYGGIITGIMNEVLMPMVYQGEIQYGIRAIMDESGAFDESDPQTRRMVEAQTLGVIMTSLREAFENPLISIQAEDLQGVESESYDNAHSYSIPSYAVMFAFFIIGVIAASLLREKEEGTFRRLLASPIHRGSIIAGTMLAYMLVVGLQVLIVFGVGSGFFDIPLGDSPLGMLLLTAALAWAATGMGMLVAALVRTRSQADGVGLVLSLIMAAVGGAIVPIPDKGFLHLLSQLTPHAHAIEGYLKLTTQESGVAEILPQAGLLVGVGFLFFVIAVWRFRFE